MAEPAAMTEDQLRALEIFNEVFNDTQSEAGKALRAKAKEKNPNLRLPEDAVEPMVAPFREENAALKARLDALEAERAEERKAAEDAKARGDLESALAGARQRYNLTDEGFDKMVARMKESGNYADADAAAAWVAQQTPPPQAPGPYLGPQNINLFGSAEKDERFALLHSDPMGKFLDAEFREFTSDPDAYVRSAGFA